MRGSRRRSQRCVGAGRAAAFATKRIVAALGGSQICVARREEALGLHEQLFGAHIRCLVTVKYALERE